MLTINNFLNDSCLLAALRKKPVNRTPCWFMRQAGRYLPEYQAIRRKHTMLTALRTPDLASEITLQPIRRFDVDAAIIFADILTPLFALGFDLDFIEGAGPKIFNPISSPEQVMKLTLRPTEEALHFTLDAIRQCQEELGKKRIPLIGFCGAPFTMASYLLEDDDRTAAVKLKRFMYEHPKEWSQLMKLLSNLSVEYLAAQVEAGASALMMFDSWVGSLSVPHFREYQATTLAPLVSKLREKVNVPLIYFGTGTSGFLSTIASLDVDAAGIDWRIRLKEAVHLTSGRLALQGNLDPALLTFDNNGIETSVRELIDDSREAPGFVFNVGHGLRPDTKPELVERTIQLIRSLESPR